MATADLQPNSSTTISKSKVKLETIDKAVNALIKWKLSESNSEKPQLMPEEDLIYLVISLAKIPSNEARTKPYKFPLPNPLHINDEICLIIDDREKSNLTSADAKKKIESEEIRVSKVLRFSKLKTDYKPFQKKRQLCDSYDLFLADRRVIPMLPKLLGKQFFKKKKLPLSVDLGHKNWKMQIKSVCSSGLFYIGNGTCSVVKVGKSSMGIGEIVENVDAAINGILEFIPKKWSSLRSLHLKFSGSVPLPIYQSVPDVRLRIEGIEGIRGDVEEELKEEEIEMKKDELVGKKRGRLHEVRYMDAVVDESDMEIDSVESDGKKRKHSDEKLEPNLNASVDEVSGKSVEKNLDDDDELVGKKTKRSDSSKGKKKVKTNDGKVIQKAKLSKNEDLGKATVVKKVEKSEATDEALKNAIAKSSKVKSRKNDVLKKANVETESVKSKKRTSAK